jgi:hypothetical protein
MPTFDELMVKALGDQAGGATDAPAREGSVSGLGQLFGDQTMKNLMTQFLMRGALGLDEEGDGASVVDPLTAVPKALTGRVGDQQVFPGAQLGAITVLPESSPIPDDDERQQANLMIGINNLLERRRVEQKRKQALSLFGDGQGGDSDGIVGLLREILGG